jgi:hypothetical protein
MTTEAFEHFDPQIADLLVDGLDEVLSLRE